MSRPCSVQVERKDIDMNKLKQWYRQTREREYVLKILAIIKMIKLRNAEVVAEFLEIEADTVRRWVKEFNEFGYDSLRKKKTLSIEGGSPPTKKSN